MCSVSIFADQFAVCIVCHCARAGTNLGAKTQPWKMTAINGRMFAARVKIVQINQICPRNLNHLASPCLSALQHQHMEAWVPHTLSVCTKKRTQFYIRMAVNDGKRVSTSFSHCVFSVISHSQHFLKETSQCTPSSWTHTCTSSGKMLHASLIFGWPSTWTAAECPARCSPRRPVCGSAVMESGRIFTSTAQAHRASPLSKRS